jgi:hypothetical protein
VTASVRLTLRSSAIGHLLLLACLTFSRWPFIELLSEPFHFIEDSFDFDAELALIHACIGVDVQVMLHLLDRIRESIADHVILSPQGWTSASALGPFGSTPRRDEIVGQDSTCDLLRRGYTRLRTK